MKSRSGRCGRRGRWILSDSPRKTVALGRCLGRQVKDGDVLFLNGNIGSGKTTFVKGLAGGMGLRVRSSEVSSPTFVLIKRYPGPVPLNHIDLYRLKKLGAREMMMIEECAHSPGATAVEWPERAEEAGLQPAYRVCFEHRDKRTRRIRIEKR